MGLQDKSSTVTKSLNYVSDFRFYVHDVRLVTDTGEEVEVTLEADAIWQQEHLALLDFENGQGHCLNGSEQTHTVLSGHAPERTFTGLRFTLGVPFDDNHINSDNFQGASLRATLVLRANCVI